MITISNNDTKLVVRVVVPSELAHNRYLEFACDLGGSGVAVTALAQRLAQELRQNIQQIRRDAYRQGARDRANKAKYFSDQWTSSHRGGCV